MPISSSTEFLILASEATAYRSMRPRQFARQYLFTLCMPLSHMLPLTVDSEFQPMYMAKHQKYGFLVILVCLMCFIIVKNFTLQFLLR